MPERCRASRVAHADLLEKLLRIIDNVAEGVVVEPAQLRGAAQQLHQAGDDEGLQGWAPAAGKHNAWRVWAGQFVVEPAWMTLVGCRVWGANMAAARHAPVQVAEEVAAHLQLHWHAADIDGRHS